MFRPVLKKKNEISKEEIKALLHTAKRAVIAFNGDDGYPYAIPINYYYDEENEKIYFHGSMVGHKVDALNRCDKVCLTMISSEEIKEEAWAPFLKSAVVFGRCHLLNNPTNKDDILKTFASKYYPNVSLIQEAIEEARNVAIYEVKIEHISGKEVQEK